MAAGRRLGAVVAAMLLVGVAASVAGAQSYGIYGVDNYFKVEAQPDERRGKPIVSGYVTNQWGLTVRNLRLRVEALDAAGGVTATYIGFVSGYVTPGSHVYFEVPVAERAPRYRVTVLSFDPVQGFGWLQRNAAPPAPA
jgi:hypothetical protein